MKDVLIGFLIIVGVFLIGDFIYSEKNYCEFTTTMKTKEEMKCGLLKKQFDLDIHFFNRLW